MWSVAKAEKDDVSDAEAQKLIESAKSAKTLVWVMSCADLEADYVMVEYLDGVDKGSRSKVHAKRFIARMADEDDPLFIAAVSSLPKDKLGSLSCRLPPRKNNQAMTVYSPKVGEIWRAAKEPPMGDETPRDEYLSTYRILV